MMILVANLSPALQLILGFCWLDWTGFGLDYCGHLRTSTRSSFLVFLSHIYETLWLRFS